MHPNGDLKETTDVCAAGPKKRVLTDLQARQLARAAIAIRSAFPPTKNKTSNGASSAPASTSSSHGRTSRKNK